jgi:hypothetical protein
VKKNETSNTAILATKGEIVSKFGTLQRCAVRLGLQPGRLSRVLKGDRPTRGELEKLTRTFGPRFSYDLGHGAGRMTAARNE